MREIQLRILIRLLVVLSLETGSIFIETLCSTLKRELISHRKRRNIGVVFQDYADVATFNSIGKNVKVISIKGRREWIRNKCRKSQMNAQAGVADGNFLLCKNHLPQLSGGQTTTQKL